MKARKHMPTRRYTVLFIIALAVAMVTAIFGPDRQRPAEFDFHIEEPLVGKSIPVDPLLPASEIPKAARSPERPVDAADPGQAVRVVVRTREAGIPVPAAEVYFLNPNPRFARDQRLLEYVGTTDEFGHIVTSTDSLQDPPGELLCLADGFATSVLTLDQWLAQHLVELDAPSALEGTVVDHDDIPVGSGVAVMAWPIGRRPSSRDIERSLTGLDPLFPARRTDDQGRFALGGLSRDKVYSVAAGGRGYASREPAQHAARPAGSSSPLRISVSRVHGVRIDFVDSQGANLPGTSNLMMTNPYPGFHIDQEQAFHIPAYLAVLAGIPAELATNENIVPGGLYVYGMEQSRPWIGPARVTFAMPGYQLVQAQVKLHWIREGLSKVEIPVTSFPGVRFGSLMVRVVGDRTGSYARCTSRRLGHLDLTPLNPIGHDRVSYRASVTTGEDGTCRVSGLPWGPYAVRFAASTNLLHVPPRAQPPSEVRIGPAEAEFVINLSKVGALELELADETGKSVTCRILASLETEGASFPLSMPGPPYVVPGVRPGRYGVQVRLDEVTEYGPRYSWNPVRIEVAVQPGELSRGRMLIVRDS